MALRARRTVPRPGPASGLASAVDDLAQRLTEAYLTYVCQAVGINEIEGYREYTTNPKFKAGIDSLAAVALAVVNDSDVVTLNVDLFHDNTAKVSEDDPAWEAFKQGLSGG